MIQTVQASLKIKSFSETPFAPSQGGPELTRGAYILSYEGGLQGQGILEELKVCFSEKRAAMTGLMRFTGRIGDFEGSFVVTHEGKSINGRVTATQTVVPGSATGGLKGLRGEMKLECSSSKDFSAAFRYRFA